VSLAVVALYEVGIAFVVTNAYPGTHQLAGSAVPLVSVTDRFVAPWVGDVVNFAGVVTSFGTALAGDALPIGLTWLLRVPRVDCDVISLQDLLARFALRGRRRVGLKRRSRDRCAAPKHRLEVPLPR
jgi:hypothetical protein